MTLTLDDLFASPDHYLHSFEGEAALFMPMDREAYHRSIFLDGRISPAASRTMLLPVKNFTERIPQPAGTGWIFHIAHCGSTLLARALDQLSTNLVLREPFALRQLGFDYDEERLALVAAMLSKRYRPDTPTIVKANVPVNFLLPHLIRLEPDAHAIFLQCSLRDYLLAILRDENHREWMRRVTTHLASHLGGLSGLADHERAAALWLAQMQAFARAIRQLPNARSLDSEAFFARPRHFVGVAARHLQVPITELELDALFKGSLFTTYSKNPALEFDNAARMIRRRSLEDSLTPELDRAQAWLDGRKQETADALAVIAASALQNE
ncbi:MAG: hypothetical protein H0W74_00340 [Sphingosinicella sp.]|nr:hypothetical protein [Sphingosinicella sp.]